MSGPTGFLIAVLEIIWFAGYLLGKDGTGFVYLVGLVVTTWALYAISQLFWLAYAGVKHDSIVTISSAFLMTSAASEAAGPARSFTGCPSSTV